MCVVQCGFSCILVLTNDEPFYGANGTALRVHRGHQSKCWEFLGFQPPTRDASRSPGACLARRSGCETDPWTKLGFNLWSWERCTVCPRRPKNWNSTLEPRVPFGLGVVSNGCFLKLWVLENRNSILGAVWNLGCCLVLFGQGVGHFFNRA